MDDEPQSVWAFVGEGGRWPSAIFSSRDRAEEWISARGLTGMLTEYPLDVPGTAFRLARLSRTGRRVCVWRGYGPPIHQQY
ncbi:DUF7710 domain-containing protein [Streptosporangium sp. CA-115845]|uniref:DUF7710 domain-containing protein n=1 Tax=Streptosporangium sp. CA-115845 TaxID=3240071 RepID=UPI003D8D13B6